MSSDSQVAESWIASFCSLLGHEYFAEVSEDFIEDDFNLTGLPSQVPMYKEALEMILDVDPDDDDEGLSEEDEEDEDEDLRTVGSLTSRSRRQMRGDINVIESSAELLYGLIHQRYINSRQGMSQMHEKYEAGHFGICPRVYCNGCKVLPVGCSDTPGQETVKLFCPGCLDIYTPPNSRFQTVDGAFFGTTFGSLFFMTYPDLQFNPHHPNPLSPSSSASELSPYQPSSAPNQPNDIHGVAVNNFAPGLGNGNIYEPRIYGFRVSERSKTGPRMQWLRMKPDDIRELDEATRYEAEYGDEISVDDDEPPPASAPLEQSRPQVDRRKKAPMRRRRRVSSEDGPPVGFGVNGAT